MVDLAGFAARSQDPTAITIKLDPLALRMVGTTAHKRMFFDVPYISHIEGNLYQGGCDSSLTLPENIEHVVSLVPWWRYKVDHELKSFLEVRMYDSLDQGMEQADRIAAWVCDCLDDGPTLVHCQAGLNRSSLIAGLALIFRGGEPVDVVKLIREKRSPACLCNDTFEQYLLDQYDG